MIQSTRLKWFIAIVVLALPTAAAQAATLSIDVVPVWNLGNGDDMRYDPPFGLPPGYGAVSHSYSIGKYEVTTGQYTEFLNAVAATDTHGLYHTRMVSTNNYGCMIERTGSSGSYSYSVAEDWADRPVNYVSWGDAARFANWLHNGQPTGAQDLTTTEDGAYYLNGETDSTALLAVSRESDWEWAIPTEDEWYKAAYHKNDGDTDHYFDFPTSNDSTPSNVLSDPDPDPGNNATCYSPSSGYTIGSPYWKTEYGDHENSESPYGTFDQGGNVFEWNETVFIGTYHVTRGGSFLFGSGFMHAGTVYYETGSNEYDYGGYIGFRVVSSAAIPEPGSLAMLAGLALMGLLYRRRRRV